VIVAVAVIVVGPVIVAVHLNGNAHVGVVAVDRPERQQTAASGSGLVETPAHRWHSKPGIWVAFQTGHMGGTSNRAHGWHFEPGTWGRPGAPHDDDASATITFAITFTCTATITFALTFTDHVCDHDHGGGSIR
jgi:hypothetical protein